MSVPNPSQMMPDQLPPPKVLKAMLAVNERRAALLNAMQTACRSLAEVLRNDTESALTTSVKNGQAALYEAQANMAQLDLDTLAAERHNLTEMLKQVESGIVIPALGRRQ